MDRPIPHNIEAEQALLGAILLNNDAYHRVAHIVTSESFFEPAHGVIFAAMGKLIDGNTKADPITLKPHLPPSLTDEVTMGQYLAKLSTEATTVLNAPDYARAVSELHLRRSLISVSDGIAHAAYDPDDGRSSAEQLADAEQYLYDLGARSGRRGGFYAFSDAVSASLEAVSAAYQNDGGLSGLPTGLTDLDRLMGGLAKSDLIILAGRPAMGKSALASNIAFTLATNGCNVGFVSLEMSREQLATRILAEQTGISSSDLRRGNIHADQYTKFAEVAEQIRTSPLFIDDAGGQSIVGVASTARRMHRQKGLDLLIIDYLQLLASGTRRNNRVEELTEITTRLKALAKELDIPVIALSQLSRQVETREDKRPHLSDLRESGSIEQDADVVLFVYRDEYYLQLKEPQEGTPEFLAWQTAMETAQGKAEIIIGKQRHGATGTVHLHFDAKLTRFGNLARRDYTSYGGLRA